MRYLKTFNEMIKIPIKVGDTVLGGRFKNKKTVVKKIGKNRLVDGAKLDYWGAWKGKQYVVPGHHQPHLRPDSPTQTRIV